MIRLLANFYVFQCSKIAIMLQNPLSMWNECGEEKRNKEEEEGGHRLQMALSL